MRRKTQSKRRRSFLQKKLEKYKDDDNQREEIEMSRENKDSEKNNYNIAYIFSGKDTPIKNAQFKETKITGSSDIMDVDIKNNTKSSPIKDNKNSSELKSKKPVGKEIANKKIKKNEKNLIENMKKEKIQNIKNISLEESDTDNEIKITSIEKIGSPSLKTRKVPKKLEKKNRIKNDEKYNKYNKMQINTKKEKNEKEKKLIECELSSPESKVEDKRGISSRKKIEKRNNRAAYNSGYITNIKSSNKILNNTFKLELKPYSLIKERKRKIILKDKINNIENILGRKRKIERRNKDLKTSNKVIDISESSESKSKKEKKPSKKKREIIKAKTPEKIINKKKASFNNLSIVDILKEFQNNSIKKYSIPELEALNQLVNYYSLDKVIDALCKPKLEIKNKLDSNLQILIDSSSKEKLPFFLIKILYVYFETKIKDNKENKEAIIKRSSSANIINNSLNNNSEKASKLVISGLNSHINGKNNNDNFKGMNINGKGLVIEKYDEKISGENDSLSPKIGIHYNFQENSNKNINKKSVKKETKIEEKKERCIGSHYNRTKDGKIYKYQVYSLDEKGNATFKCFDDKCCSIGNYNLDTQKFFVNQKHNLKYENHDYIINLDNNRDNVFIDLLKYNKFNAQVFKENGVRNVIIY